MVRVIITLLGISMPAAVALTGCGSSKSTLAQDQSDGSAGRADAVVGSGGQSDVQSGGASGGPSAQPVAGAPAIVGDGNCASPYIVAGAVELPNESTARATNAISALSAGCLGTETSGPDRIYKIQIPATGTTKLKVTVTPTQKPQSDAFDPVIFLTTTCVAHPTACLACKDSRGGGSFETVEYNNQSGATKDVLLVVDGFDFQPQGGAYKLDVSLSNP